MNAVQECQANRWLKSGLVLAIAIAVPLLRAAEPASPVVKSSAKTFRLADGHELPIEQYGDTYETVEWQPPIDVEKAKTIVDVSKSGGGWMRFYSIAIDHKHKKLYWILGVQGDGGGGIFRSELDGSNAKKIVAEMPFSKQKRSPIHPRSLCLAPESGKMYWMDYADAGSRSVGYAIWQANLDGTAVKSIVTGLDEPGCTSVDESLRKIYWQSNGLIHRADLDGSKEEDLEARFASFSGLAFDFSAKRVYGSSKEFQVTCRDFDGKEVVASPRKYSNSTRFIQIDAKNRMLYWHTGASCMRAPLDTLGNAELVVMGNSHRNESPFVVDAVNDKFYWSGNNGEVLFVAPLPKLRPRVTKIAPPLIESLDASLVEVGQTVRLVGTKLQTTRRVFWIGFPTGEVHESKAFRPVSDTQLEVVVPEALRACTSAAIAIVTDGGATVTLAHDLIYVDRHLTVERSSRDSETSYWVQSGGLFEVEKRIVYERGRAYRKSGLRGGNSFFVTNGLGIGPDEKAALIIYEPYVSVPLGMPKDRTIAVGAIRPSFVDRLLEISSSR